MLILYQRTDCPFCWKVRLALAELSIDYELVETRLGEKHPEVLRLSPTGTVPVMVDGEVVIWESSVMLDYLDAKYAPGKLVPRAPDQQVAMRSVHAYSDKCIGPALRNLVFEKRSKPESVWDRELIQSSEYRWLECQAYLESLFIIKSLSGNEFGAAHCALAARCGVAEAYCAAVSSEFPVLHRWFAETKVRPAWDAAFPEYFLSTQ